MYEARVILTRVLFFWRGLIFGMLPKSKNGKQFERLNVLTEFRLTHDVFPTYAFRNTLPTQQKETTRTRHRLTGDPKGSPQGSWLQGSTWWPTAANAAQQPAMAMAVPEKSTRYFKYVWVMLWVLNPLVA